MNSRWSSRRDGLRAPLLLLALVLACGKGEEKAAAPQARVPTDPVLADATLLGTELREVMDRVMAYRSSHQKRLPASLRQAGIDSLTPQFIRRLERQGSDPLVTIAFRRLEGRAVSRCRGTNVVLEDLVVRGSYDIACDLTSGGFRSVTITK
ncbi:MAG TPA: hypothetical protein VG817_01340 [Gemmatimonadales bacterium]|nr:hypothetical protein [Gemmatimonadales bacterium]